MPGTQTSRAGRRAVVAGDDTLIAGIVELLEGNGFEVRRAGNGLELNERLAGDGHFDVIVTEVALRWMNGTQVMHQARFFGIGTPVVFVSELKDPGLADWVHAFGDSAELVRRPFEAPALLAAIERLIARAPGR